ncbi:MAG: nitroreductase family deazaflavin-dependent oxidoreductase [Chloroflexota bacterium]
MGLVRQKPRGFLRWFLRAPIVLYRLRLGWLLTGHFLLLTTVGRKSGRLRQAVVEVVKVDRAADTYFIVSGWGPKSDWFQNIQREPSVRVDVGIRRFHARAECLPAGESAQVLYEYARKHPAAFKQISRTLSGELVEASLEACSRLVQSAPMVALRPS